MKKILYIFLGIVLFAIALYLQQETNVLPGKTVQKDFSRKVWTGPGG